jgi:hypothetical protein
MWYWKRMTKLSWTDGLKKNEVLQRIKEGRNILYTIKERKVN